jgi:hypothetical protein
MRNETRFRMVEKVDPDRFKRFLSLATRHAEQRYAGYQQLAGLTIPNPEHETEQAPEPAGTTK